ncbi:lytic transglycosylase domain-containing protein [Glycomyces xiaoerkulensis]|uniref:lytic transglycosylase domain-containing protein n=1 Tax=Glycomyces xiaoerkulensis TaxID=2038139 RepID=UPI000C2676EB|nr:lytic transglycosylase domain-containing protein [Glycomyces xiaoerkulensis]
MFASVWFALLLRRLASLPWKALKGFGRGVRGCARWLRSPVGRLAVKCAVTATVLAGALTAGYHVVPGAGPAWSFGVEPSPEPEERPLFLTPEDAPDPGLPAETDTGIDPIDAAGGDPTEEATQQAAEDLDGWAQSLEFLGIPQRALLAYGRAELVSAYQNPGCNLSWTTLAGIGATESDHGTVDGNRITADGGTLSPIVGPEHNEQGPMQFMTETWDEWGADGNGDGAADPHNIDDATTAAADYLCTGGRDLTDPADWYAAVHSYNPVEEYVQKVYDRADDYGAKSTQH